MKFYIRARDAIPSIQELIGILLYNMFLKGESKWIQVEEDLKFSTTKIC